MSHIFHKPIPVYLAAVLMLVLVAGCAKKKLPPASSQAESQGQRTASDWDGSHYLPEEGASLKLWVAMIWEKLSLPAGRSSIRTCR